MKREFSASEKRALAVATGVALLFGAYFLRGFFVLIVMAGVAAYLFTPLYHRFRRRFGSGASAALTLLSAVLMVIVPVTALVAFAIIQITQMINAVSGWVAETDLSAMGDRTLQVVNELLARVPFLDVTVTPDTLRDGIATAAQRGGEWLLGVLQGAVGGLFGAVTASVIFLYVFVSMLLNREKIHTLIRQLNPLGEEVTDLYLAKTGAMVSGTVKGQFVIALCQGLAGAISIYLAGFHDGFFIFAILLSALSVIPLGGGIVSVPFGIGMMFFGNIVGGIFVVAFHLLVVTNIDNVLRPILVPRAARLDPALMLLAVFAGIAMFGFFGIVIGPVLMIIIVTTISVYLVVYRGVEIDLDDDHEEPKPKKPRKWLWRRKTVTAPAATPPAATPPAEQ